MPGQSAQGRVPSKRPAKARTSRPSGAGALSTSRSTSVACSSAAGSAVVGATVGGGVAASPGAAASVDGLQPARAIAAASRAVVNRVRFVIECSVGGRSEEHTSELQSLMRISYAVFCLKKKPLHSITYSLSLHNTTQHQYDITSHYNT